MKMSVHVLALLITSVGGSLVLADSTNTLCEGVKERTWKARQVVDERLRSVQLAQGQTRLAYSQLVECRPGAAFSAGRAQRCAHAQSEVPLHVQFQLDAEDQLHEALADYQENAKWISHACSPQEPLVNQEELLNRISMLENEVKELKTYVEQLNDR